MQDETTVELPSDPTGGEKSSLEKAAPAPRRAVEFDLRTLLLARFTLFAAAAYLLLFQPGARFAPSPTAWILGAGLFSCVLLFRVPAPWFHSFLFIGSLLALDTLWVTAAMLSTGKFDPEFIFIYYLVIFLAGIGENLGLIVLATMTGGGAYLFVAWFLGGWARVLDAEMLGRLPFLVAVAAFYGYVVERSREQRRLAREERLTAERAERSFRLLEERSAQVESANQELKLAEEHLTRLNEELQRASEMKSSLVSMVSHELRTPLAAMKEALEILEMKTRASDDEVQHRFLEIALRNTARLTSMVNDLLDISKIEAGRIQLQFGETEVADCLQAVMDTFEAQAATADVELTLRAPASLPSLWADPDRLEQIAINLVGNALKFTPAGGRIAIEVALHQDLLQLTVADTGPGIAAVEQEKIFERFYQIDNSLTRTVTGSGLGLAICRDLVEEHGGRLSVESEEGAGSRFTFTVPVASQRAREMTALQEVVREFRTYPIFCLSLVELRGTEALNDFPPAEPLPEELMRAAEEYARGFLPRSVDRLVAQPYHGRLVIGSLGTDLAGAMVMGRRLEVAMGAEPMRGQGTADLVPRFRGPVEYPDQGRTGWQLVEAIEVQEREIGREEKSVWS